MSIKEAYTAERKNINKETDRQDNRSDNYVRHILLEALVGLKYGTKQKNKTKCYEKRNYNVKRCVNTEIHSGKSYKCDDSNAHSSLPLLRLVCRNGTECAGNILGVTRGEGIACGLCPRRLDNVELGIKNPRTGDSEEELGNLIHNGADKTCDKNKIALTLINTPEEYDCKGEEKGLLTNMSYGSEKPVENRVANTLKEK